jgi:glycosyltransferase involved in cell wall biosynthesis
MNFSIILNTRKRVPLLKSLLESIERKTENPKNVEVLIRYDSDDDTTHDFLTSYIGKNTHMDFAITRGPRVRNLHTNLNSLANASRGRFVFVLNDDTEILTNHWDRTALENLNNFKAEKGIKDDILYGFTHDTSVDKAAGKGYASFPIISKQAVNTLGFFMYENFVGLGGDSSIHRVYEPLGRVVDTKIALDHIYHNSFQKIMNPDPVAMEMRQYTMENPVDPFAFDVSADVDKLKNYIKNYE